MANILDQQLQNYFVQLNDAEKKSVLLMLKTFLAGRKKNEEYISIEDYNTELDNALAEAQTGYFTTQDDIENQSSKW